MPAVSEELAQIFTAPVNLKVSPADIVMASGLKIALSRHDGDIEARGG